MVVALIDFLVESIDRLAGQGGDSGAGRDGSDQTHDRRAKPKQEI